MAFEKSDIVPKHRLWRELRLSESDALRVRGGDLEGENHREGGPGGWFILLGGV